MNKNIIITAGAAALVSAAVASLVVSGIVTGPIGRDSQAMKLEGATSAVTEGTPYYLSCGVLTPRRPVDGFLDCIAPGHQLVDLFWTDWSHDTADGTGRLGFASCLCEDPLYTWYPVTVHLSDPRAVRNGTVFSGLTVSYLGDRPSGAPAEEAFSLTDPAN